MPVTILDEALITLDEAKRYLGAGGATFASAEDDLLTEMINFATGQMELYTGRKLKSRAYADDEGTEPLYLDGNATGNLYASEYPITAWVGARYLDGGTWYTIDDSGVWWDSAGLISLPNAVFPRGSRNIELSVTAGIDMASSQGRALASACCRWVQVLLADARTAIGRGSTINIGGVSTVADFSTAMPRDVEKIVRAFARY